MSTAGAFSTGFSWDDVAPAATPIATPANAPASPALAALSQTVATLDATPFSPDFAWNDDAVASVAGVASEQTGGNVSQNAVADRATLVATPRSAVSRPLPAEWTGPVADVASVANWAAGVELVCRSRCPDGFRDTDWRQLVADAELLMQQWGSDLFALGWSTLEVFGVNKRPAARRLDVPGLLFLLNGKPVEALDRDTALLRANARDHMTFYRNSVAEGGVPVWHWVWGMDR